MRGKNMDIRSPADCPYYLISRATLAITSFLRKELSDTGAGNIKPAYLGVLLSLWNEDNLRANELGKRAGLEPSSMTGLLDRMEKDGLLKRTPDPEDRRAFRILLTPLGADAEKASMEAVSRVLTRVFVDIPEKDIDTVKEVLRKVWTNCSKEDL
jgi:DNA-binding MarR family transcriptional regulator